jgi:hypothetical protein
MKFHSYLQQKKKREKRIRNWEDQIMNKFSSNYNNKRRKEEEEIFFCRVKSSVGGGR